jgi:hypothetical protein
MPKLYEYFGLVVLFYANEHAPVHVHGKFQGRECRAEIILLDGRIMEIRFLPQKGRRPLKDSEMRQFQELVTAKAEEIVQKWIDFFVLHKPVPPVTILKRL